MSDADIIPIRPALPERLTPASMRLLGTAVGDLAESLGGALTTQPVMDPVYVGEGRASIALILTVSVAALNEYAAEDDRNRNELDDRRTAVLGALTNEWQSAEAIGVASGLGYVVMDLIGLFDHGKAERVGEMWRRR